MKKIILTSTAIGALVLGLIGPVSQAWSKGLTMLTEPHEVVLLNRNLSSWYARWALIESAQKSIEIEYYILFPREKSTRLLLQTLYRKAQEGVKVRILVDKLPLTEMISDHLAEKFAAVGIEVRYYNGMSLLDVVKSNHRNHRKLITVDDKYALTGGRNLSDKYYDLNPRMNFLDRDLLVKGPLAKEARESFDLFWNSSKSQPHEKPVLLTPEDFGYKSEKEMRRRQFSSEVDRTAYRNYRNQKHVYFSGFREAEEILTETDKDRALKEELLKAGRNQFIAEYQGPCHDMKLVSDFPEVEKRSRSVYETINSKIVQAEDSVLVEVPYFIVREQDKMFESLRSVGKKVTVLTNSLYSTDNILTISAFYSRVNQLIKKGVGFLLFKGRKPQGYESPLKRFHQRARWGIHSKSLVVDDQHTIVGSHNFDPRSKNLNAEIAFICSGNRDLAQALRKDILLRAKSSTSLNEDSSINQYQSKYVESSSSKILLHYILSPFAALLEDQL